MKSTAVGKACKLRSIQRGRRNISGVSGEEEGSPTIPEEEPMDDFWGRIRKGAMRTNGH
jgi:hypothetical protein